MQVVTSFNNPRLLSIGQVANRKAFKTALVVLLLIGFVGFVIWLNKQMEEKEEARKKQF